MSVIRQLSASVINKIAAGEVIERPSSVVKELLENAVDAGSHRIDVSVEQGGAALMRVADDGSGMTPDDLPLAVASHATSKIESADDLFAVRTLGFRGEALASIAEISHFLMRSRTSADHAGSEMEVRAGTISPVVPCGCPVGTVIEVRNLFCNTPVRRRFLRTTQTEMGHVAEAFTRIALAHPEVHFTLQHNERTLFDIPPADRWRDRIGTFFGGEVSENLIWVESSDETAGLSGYVADPSVSRSNNRMQYLFLNGRFIRDRQLQHALGEAYRGLLMTGRFPVAFLRLQLPPESIDVNVHPTKLEVRFQDGNRLYSQLLGTLRNQFLTSDLTARIQSHGDTPTGGQPEGLDANAVSAHRDQISGWARGEAAAVAVSPPSERQDDLQFPKESRGSAAAWQQSTPGFRPFPVHVAGQEIPLRPLYQPHDAAAPSRTDSRTMPVPRPMGLQLHNRYLVTESQDGMVIIDQHALHERILYEQLREKVMEGCLETQKLLVPEPVSLTAEEAAIALDARDTLGPLGMEIEAFGGDTVLISSYPAMLANLPPREILRHVIDILATGAKTPDRRDVLDELLHMISCKAAIKAGDRLSAEEVNALIEQRELFQDTHHCPHGRPTALVFTRDELDKRFKRT
jgi:DNA mismatch repair protein MutL